MEAHQPKDNFHLHGKQVNCLAVIVNKDSTTENLLGQNNEPKNEKIENTNCTVV